MFCGEQTDDVGDLEGKKQPSTQNGLKEPSRIKEIWVMSCFHLSDGGGGVIYMMK